MKVLFSATDIFTRGGIARYTSTLASSLAAACSARENVDVLCFFDWGYSGELPSEFRVLGMVSGRGACRSPGPGCISCCKAAARRNPAAMTWSLPTT